MARQAKDTVKVTMGETDYEVSPSLDFEIEKLGVNEVSYLLSLGMKQRIGAAVRAAFTAMGPEIEQTLKAMKDLRAIGADEDLILKFVKGKPSEYPTELTLGKDDIFPSAILNPTPEPEPEVKVKKGKK